MSDELEHLIKYVAAVNSTIKFTHEKKNEFEQYGDNEGYEVLENIESSQHLSKNILRDYLKTRYNDEEKASAKRTIEVYKTKYILSDKKSLVEACDYLIYVLTD